MQVSFDVFIPLVIGLAGMLGFGVSLIRGVINTSSADSFLATRKAVLRKQKNISHIRFYISAMGSLSGTIFLWAVFAAFFPAEAQDRALLTSLILPCIWAILFILILMSPRWKIFSVTFSALLLIVLAGLFWVFL